MVLNGTRVIYQGSVVEERGNEFTIMRQTPPSNDGTDTRYYLASVENPRLSLMNVRRESFTVVE